MKKSLQNQRVTLRDASLDEPTWKQKGSALVAAFWTVCSLIGVGLIVGFITIKFTVNEPKPLSGYWYNCNNSRCHFRVVRLKYLNDYKRRWKLNISDRRLQKELAR